jgi:alpha-tubulin suppressor-like RCC1 family protein/outer membrane protein assembly factor BamB
MEEAGVRLKGLQLVRAFREDAGLILRIPDVMPHMKSWSVSIALFVSIVFAGAAKPPAPPAYPDEPKWTFRTGGAVTASPALSEDGTTLYVGSADRYFYAIDTELGTTNWLRRLPAAITDAATIDDDGTIYVPCANGALYALVDEGDTNSYKWVETINGVERPSPFRAQRPGLSSPVITDDGTIYIGSTDNRLYALFSQDGTVKEGWPLVAANDVDTPVVATTSEDGEGDTIYFTSGGKLYGVSFDGDQQSVFAPGTSIHSIPAIGEDGSIFFGADNERVYALSSGGTSNDVRWRFNTGENVSSSPVIGVGGEIYIGSESARLYCLNTNGALRWSVSTRKPVHSALSIGADGTIYAGSDDKNMYAVTADGDIRWVYTTKGRVRSAAAIDSEGTIYFGSSDKNVYALYDDAPSDSGDNVWPMFRRDRYHSARATEATPFITQEPLGTNVPASFIASNVVNGISKFVVTDGSTALTVTNGNNVLVSVIARAASAVSYQWRLDGENINPSINRSATNATLVLTNIQPSAQGIYSVAVENDFAVAYSDEFSLTVISGPVLTATLTNQFLLAGGTLFLDSGAQGTQPLFYQWKTNGVAIPGETNATLTITNVQPENSGIYSVMVMNSVDTTNSTPITVTIFPVTLTLAEHPVAAGPRHSLAVLPDHTLWAWGLNNFGQLGNTESGVTGTNQIFRNTPQLIGPLGTNGSVNTNAIWASVSAGGRGADVATNQPGGFSLAIQTNGSLWAWGANHFGQLGIGSTALQRTPTLVGSDSNWFQVEAGATHTLALKRDGSLWAWGGNNVGQLGFGNTTATSVPLRVGAESAWVEIRAGGFFSLARRADGTIWAWGANTNRQLGLGANSNRSVPTMIGTNSDWAGLSAGVGHSLALKTNRTLWAWGQNDSGQLGIGTDLVTTNLVQVGTETDWLLPEAGNAHSFALKTNGALFAWGANTFGQLGNGQTSPNPNVLPIGIASDPPWRAIDASTHSLGMTIDGRVWAWGWNSHGQVGDGTTNNRSAPVVLNFNAGNAVTNPPTITQQPVGNLLVNENATAGFTVSAFGPGILVYQWYFNSNVISTAMNPSAMNPTLSITNVTSTNAGFYHVIITNAFGRVTSTVARLSITITSGAPIIVQGPTNRTVITNSTVSFAVTVTGGQPFFYQWRFNLNPIDSATNLTATNATLTLSNVTAANQGFYDVIITNSFGATSTTPAQLFVTNGVAPITPPGPLGIDRKSAAPGAVRLGKIIAGSEGVAIEVIGNAAGRKLVLEYQDRLGDAEWRPLSTNDSGALKLYDATPPANRSRFYRLRLE